MTLAPSAGRTEILNGIQIYFEVHGTGDPVILLHGFSGSSIDWMPSIKEWGAGFQIIVPDLRGHGPVIGARWPEFVKSASAFLRE